LAHQSSLLNRQNVIHIADGTAEIVGENSDCSADSTNTIRE